MQYYHSPRGGDAPAAGILYAVPLFDQKSMKTRSGAARMLKVPLWCTFIATLGHNGIQMVAK